MARKSGAGYGKLALGFVLGIVAVVVGVFLFFKFGGPPVAVADPAFPFEKQVVHVPLDARIARDLKTPPFGTSEDVFESGARIYKAQCANCHGVPGHDVVYAAHMYPVAPQLWKKHARGNIVGVSDDEAGETYWKVVNGIRLTGMPSYDRILSDTEMWQVTLLLKNADKELPLPVMQILKSPRS